MAWAPFAARFPVRNHSGALAANLGLIEHVQQGNGSLRHFFDEPANRASAHWWVSRTGAIEQYIDSDLRSWAQMAGNSTYCSVETEGWGRDPLTDAQVNALAKLYRWGHQTHGWPYQLANRPGERGFGVHYMGGAAWGGHPCPEALRAAQRPRILSLAAGGIPTDQEDDMAGYADQLNRIEMFSSSAHTQAGAAFSFMAPTIGAAVEQFYEQYLGRKPSEHDVDAWVAEVVTKSRTRAQLEAAIAGSPEAKARAKA